MKHRYFSDLRTTYANKITVVIDVFVLILLNLLRKRVSGFAKSHEFGNVISLVCNPAG